MDKNKRPIQEMKVVSNDMIQALADLGYPADVRKAMSYDEISIAIEKSTRYQGEKQSLLEKEDEPKPKSIKIPEYQGDPAHKAAYELDLVVLQELVKERKDADVKDSNLNTLLHLAVNMAFQDFEKALKVIKFLRSKDANIFLRNDQDYTPLDIAEQRSIKTSGYLDIVEALKS